MFERCGTIYWLRDFDTIFLRKRFPETRFEPPTQWFPKYVLLVSCITTITQHLSRTKDINGQKGGRS